MTGSDKTVNTHHHYYGAAVPNAPAYAPGPTQGYGAQPYGAAAAPAFSNSHRHPGADSLVKGLLVGAAAAYLLSNETAQRVILRNAVQAFAALRGGVEELKERFHDAEAEVAAEAVGEAPKAADATGQLFPAAEI